jgi:hypothetical protein
MIVRLLMIVIAVVGLRADAASDNPVPKVGVQFSISERASPHPPVLRFLVRSIEGGKGQHSVRITVSSVRNTDVAPDIATGYRFSHDLLNLLPRQAEGLCRNQRPFVMTFLADNRVIGVKSKYRPVVAVQLDGKAAEVVILNAAGDYDNP